MRRAREQVKIFFIEKKWWTACLCLCLAAAMFYVVNYPAAIGASAASRQLPIYCVQRDQKLVSISFDAAWGNEDTQQLIDILSQYQVPATFFVVGEWVDKYPESVKALHDAGHEVMNHSNTHAHYPQLSASQVVEDLNACNDKIEAVTGVRPTLVRLPYGDYDDNSINAVRSIGMEPIQWDVEAGASKESSWGAMDFGFIQPTVCGGGACMKITHTHPDYSTPDQRRQALQEIKQLCTAILQSQKQASAAQDA